ncbi:disaggregatase related repeat-containing protein, partial [Methanomethylovorans sp.]|uniref:disaggregatase related repeat-containing protein n=1 Tax=Methanomethylovorans sp. TaxID=2758717 RepID=UPI00351C3A49
MIMITGVGSADDVNVELLSDFGGNAYDVEIFGDYAYLGQGQDLVVLNIADIRKPSEVGRIITPSVVSAIAVSGDYAYIGDGSSGLTIVDITDPASPQLMGTYAGIYDSSAYSVVVSGQYAYVTNQFPGNLQIIDISDPSAPTLAGNYDVSGQGNANGVAISGNYAYVAAGGLIIVDISDPSPQPVSIYKEQTYALDVAVSGNYAYVADADKGLIILNITDPSSPALAGSYVTENIGYTRIAVSGNYAYAGEYSSFSIIDISNPASPDLVSTYATDGNTNNFAVAEDYAYIAGSGLEIVDIGNPSVPAHMSNYYNGDWAWDVSVSGDYAHVTSWNGLTIADISDPSSPAFAGKYDVGGGADEVDVQGNYAYVASGGSDSVLVSVVDITDPSVPTLTGSAGLFADNGVGIDVEGNYACVGVGFPGLSILDISDPVSPEYIGHYGSYGPENCTQNVVVSGNYAYVLHDFELSILDISDPSSPVLASSYPTRISDVAVSGNYAYLAADDVLILDVSDPAAPELAGSYDTSGASYIAISGNYAYVVSDNGLIVLDISDPFSPQLAGSYSGSTISGSITVSGDYVYVANRERGLTILRVGTVPGTNPTTTVSYTASYDNRLRESSPSTVLSTTTYLDIGRSASRCRDVMLFDLSGYQPTDTISKATLSLYWYYPAGATRASDTVVEVYRPVEWDPKYVTWRSRASGTLWSTAGGNWFDKNGVSQGSTPYASLTFAGSKTPDNKYYELDVTQLVQDYVSGKYKNAGFFLKAKTESGNYIAFYSTDWSNAAQRPKLTVTSTSDVIPTDNAPVANAGDDMIATAGSTVTFDGSASSDDKGIASYSWDFDASNGITSEATGVTATKTYTTAGNYTVALTVTDTS